jgi:hypothetical protein
VIEENTESLPFELPEFIDDPPPPTVTVIGDPALTDNPVAVRIPPAPAPPPAEINIPLL